MLDFRPFEIDDLRTLLVPGNDLALDFCWDLGQLFFAGGPAATVTINCVAVCAFGVHICSAGVGEAWVVFTPQGRGQYRPIYRAMRSTLTQAMDLYSLHRVQAHVKAIDQAAVRLVKHLGMEAEGLCRSLDLDRNDYLLFARTE